MSGRKKKPLKESLSQIVYLKLIEKFHRNELVPGDILNRRDVADDFGVSVAPVLEALLQLELEGFVESRPRKGTMVKPIRQEDVFGQLMVREAIECQAVRLYCGQPIHENMVSLKQKAEALDELKSDPDSVDHWKNEIDFHRSLVALTRCNALIREFDRTIRLGIFYSLNRIISNSVKKERSNHSELLLKLSEADPDTAENILRVHLRSGKGKLHPFR